MKKRILVTGGAGYIGSHTVIALYEAGYLPIIVDNYSNSSVNTILRIEDIISDKIQTIELDCTNYSDLLNTIKKLPTIHGIIHFAAYKSVSESIEYPLKYYENNITSTLNILKLCHELGINNLVFSSSCTVYGRPSILPVTEESPIQEAESVYGYTKQVCEKIIMDTGLEIKNLKSTVLRYFNPIGAHPSGNLGEFPKGKPNNLVPYLTQALAKLRETLTVFGIDYPTKDGSCIRDYIHVMDLSEAHVAALKYLDSKENGTYIFNIGTGKGYSVLELIHTFEKVNNISVEYKVGPRRTGDVVEIYANTDKANKELRWSSRYSLEDALFHAWQWQKNNL